MIAEPQEMIHFCPRSKIIEVTFHSNSATYRTEVQDLVNGKCRCPLCEHPFATWVKRKGEWAYRFKKRTIRITEDTRPQTIDLNKRS